MSEAENRRAACAPARPGRFVPALRRRCQPPPPPGEQPGCLTILGTGLIALVTWPLEALDALGELLTDRMLHGRAVRGALDSTAGRYAQAVPPTRKLAVVVTDGQLIILQHPHSPEVPGVPPAPYGPDALVPLWGVPLTEVTGARRRWHRLHGARLRICFRDGSWLELTGPLLLGRDGAEALRAALTR